MNRNGDIIFSLKRDVKTEFENLTDALDNVNNRDISNNKNMDKIQKAVCCICKDLSKSPNKDNYYLNDRNELRINSGRAAVPVIFQEGKWAEIIEETKEMTLEQLNKELRYKVKIVE